MARSDGVIEGDAYFEVLKEDGLREYRETPGNQGVIVLRRTDGDLTHFLLITFWESFDAIRRFTGPNPDHAVYYSEGQGVPPRVRANRDALRRPPLA